MVPNFTYRNPNKSLLWYDRFIRGLWRIHRKGTTELTKRESLRFVVIASQSAFSIFLLDCFAWNKSQYLDNNRPFLSCPKPLFQSEAKWNRWYENDFYTRADGNHYHKKRLALNLALKGRVFGTRKWSIILSFQRLPSSFSKALTGHFLWF